MNLLELPFEPWRDSDYSQACADKISRMASIYAPTARKSLDLGMGRGYLVKKLSEIGLEAVGVDVRDLGQEGLILANVKSLPFEDASFDLVTECYLLADMIDFQEAPVSDLRKVIQEAHRVLRPEGIYITKPGSYLAKDYFKETLLFGADIGIFRK